MSSAYQACRSKMEQSEGVIRVKENASPSTFISHTSRYTCFKLDG